MPSLLINGMTVSLLVGVIWPFTDLARARARRETEEAFAIRWVRNRFEDLREQLRVEGPIGHNPRTPVTCELSGHQAYLRGNVARAIFAYRIGLTYAPTNERLRRAWEWVQSEVNCPIANARARLPSAWFDPRVASNLLFLGSFVLYLAGGLAIASWCLRRRGKAAGIGIACLLLAGAMCWLSFSLAQYPRGLTLAVVREDGVTLHQGNGHSYPLHAELTQVNTGMEARILHRRGHWLQLEFPGGYVGWLPAEKVLVGLF